MKKFTLLMLVAVLVLGLLASVVVARGPANRATGLVWFEGTGDIHVEFDAHMAKDDRPAKGSICWYRYGDLRFELDVICCKVDGITAWFAAGPTGPDDVSDLGYLVFKVIDGGTPGDNGDALSVQWVNNETDACTMVVSGDDPIHQYTIIEGNLVVHYYEE